MARDDAGRARAWAVTHGLLEDGSTGRISQEIYDAYDARDPDEPVTGRVIPPDDDASEAAPPPPPRPRAERKPRDVPGSRPPRAAWRPGWLGGDRGKPAAGKPARGKAKDKPAREARPRMPVDELLSAGWRGLAGAVAPVLPATARMMKLQSPVVGVVLDPVVRDTVLDRLLQPLARTTETGEAIAVIVLPPILVGLMEADPRRAPVMMPVLRGCMLRWGKIAGPAMGQALRREQEFEADFGQTVDDMIALLGMEFETPADEDAAVYEAQQGMAAQAGPGEPDTWQPAGGQAPPPPPEFTPAQAARQAAEANPMPGAQQAPVPAGLRFDPRLAPVVPS